MQSIHDRSKTSEHWPHLDECPDMKNFNVINIDNIDRAAITEATPAFRGCSRYEQDNQPSDDVFGR